MTRIRRETNTVPYSVLRPVADQCKNFKKEIEKTVSQVSLSPALCVGAGVLSPVAPLVPPATKLLSTHIIPF